MPGNLTYGQLIAGESNYYDALDAAAAKNSGPPVPTQDNYVGNGENDLWNKAEALSETYFQGQYTGIDFTRARWTRRRLFTTARWAWPTA
jgi:hypothetical protein